MNYVKLKKKNLSQLFVHSFICLVYASFFILSSCALPAAPDGGPRDTKAPQIISSNISQGSTNVSTSKLIWTFNEYVVLKSPTQNIYSSPPLPGATKYETRGKSFIISWEDSLIKNATYVLQWGAAIRDLHEGNIIKGVQWVFSTGSSLDSGEVIGRIVNPWTGLPVKDIAVCLYPESIENDSVVFKPALYSTRSNDSGFYKFQYIGKNRDYNIRAFADPDGNNRLSVGELTPIAVIQKVKPHQMRTDSSEDRKVHSLPLMKANSISDSIIDWTPWGADSSGALNFTYIDECANLNNYKEYLIDNKVKPIVIQLKGEDGIYAQWTSVSVCDTNYVTVSGLPPGKYTLQAFYDRNEDGFLNTGNYWTGDEPEAQIYANDPIEIKANWTIETKWEINRLDPIYQNFH
ncbi:MAG: Uncharacterised protein [Owenweeksia sp. TMED14]|nr:MAG: Uncharacterised protein [Owenweeksia sp. TMED14]